MSSSELLPDIQTTTFINVPPSKAFECLTTAEGWNSWFTTETTIDLKPGGKIWLVWRDWSVNHVDHEDGGTILEVVQDKKFSFKWHADLTSETTVTFTLEEHKTGTILKVVDSGYKAEQLTAFAGFLDCALGWGEAVTLLKFYLEHGVTYGKVPR